MSHPPRIRVPVGPVVALVLAAAFPAPTLAQATSALVSQFRGDVKVLKASGGEEFPVRVGLRLVQGDQIDVARGSRAVLLFNNGRLVTATTPLVVAPVGGAGAAEIYERAARTLASAGRQDRPAAKSGVGRPPPAGAYPLVPGFGTAVLHERPTFAWQAQQGAEAYVLQIRPVEGGPPLRFPVAGAGPWTLPDTVTALARGAEYAWTVLALPSGRVGGEERFRVLDEGSSTAFAAFLASLRDAGVDPDGDGLLLVAMYAADLGLLHEAEAALARLVASTSAADRDPVVDLLHAQLLEKLGRTEEAVAAHDLAGRKGA